MMLLEHQHRSQPDGLSSTASNVHANLLRVHHEVIPLRTVPRDERAHPASSEVHNLIRVALRQGRQPTVEVLARDARVFDKIQALNFLDDRLEEQRPSWVAHPGVKLAVRLVGTEVGSAVVVAGGLGLLAKGHHIWWCG